MYNADNVSKRFIVEEKLGHVWIDKLQQLFHGPEWQEEDVAMIRASYLKVLSILILIGWSDVCWGDKTCFRNNFLDYPESRRSDPYLPFDVEGLDLPTHLKERFHKWQYAFCPVVIEEHEWSQSPNYHIQTVDPERRLPFKGDECGLGVGASGAVERVTIARHYHRIYFESGGCHENSQVSLH